MHLSFDPYRIFAFWTGENPITETRKQCFDSFHSTGLNPVLITAENLPRYILPEFPLHSAYHHLTPVHRADYLRAYFMLHYGGGYSDIKFHSHSWLPAVEEILSSKRLMGGGYRQVRGGMPWLQNNAVLGRTYVHSYSVPPYIAKIVTDAMRGFYKLLIGPSAFYFKPDSLFCRMWMKEVHRRLDVLLPFLPDHPPSHPRDRAGGIDPKENLAGVEKGKYRGYPVPWSFILADIVEPACLLFWPFLSRKIPPPKFENYL